jgi:ribonuclease P protein component
VLPKHQRVRRSEHFRLALRSPARSATRNLVVHVARIECQPDSGQGATAGFIVSRAVGGAVVRNRVRRRLRAQMQESLKGLPPDATVIVRALPPSASLSGPQLAADLTGALTRAVRRLGHDSVTPESDVP